MAEQLLLAALLLGVGLGFALMWRRLETLSQEIRQLRIAIESAQHSLRLSEGARTGAARGATQPAFASVLAHSDDAAPAKAEAPRAPLSDDPFNDAWVRGAGGETSLHALLRAEARSAPTAAPPISAPPIETPAPTPQRPARSESPAAKRALPQLKTPWLVGFALALIAPFAPFVFPAPAWAPIGLAMAIYPAALWLSRRPLWSFAAWTGALAAALWALFALGAGAAGQAPASFCGALLLLGGAGAAHARWSPSWRPGAVLAFCMISVLTSVGAHDGVIGPPGIALAGLSVLAAAIGASQIRLDVLHLLGFLGAGAALFILSDQDPAGVWFTPAMAWSGAAFLGLAAARVPAMGREGALIAATGALAPISAIGALYAAGHGLEQSWSAAIAWALSAVLQGGLLAFAARQTGSVKALGLTGWVLGAGVSAAFLSALAVSAPLALAGPILAGAALALVALDRRYPERLWLFGAACFAALAFASAVTALIGFNATGEAWMLAALAGLGMAAPTLLLALAAKFAAPRARITEAVLEIFAGLAGLLALSALVRVIFTGGAPAVNPIGLAELGAHAGLWLALCLGLYARAHLGATDVRQIGAAALPCAAAAAAIVAIAIELAGGWAPSGETRNWADHAPLGFALMALAAWGHVFYWRRQREQTYERAAFAAACVLSAAYVNAEFAWSRQAVADDGADWASISVGAAAFIIAFAAIFAAERLKRRKRSHFQENLQGHG